MNRNFITKLTGVCLILFVSLLFMTCNPGLGKAVDTQPPKVAVEYPVTKSVLKGGFTMEGIATDEVKIVSCTVTFKNIKTSKEYKFPAETADGRFSVSINDPNPDGSFDIPDGDYNVTVSVSDAYRNATADVVYTIDNTSPTVLITSPNAYISSNWPDMYKTVTIKGEVFDANTISQVEVFIIDKNGNRLVSQIADGTSSFVATFSEPAIEDGEYFYYVVATDAGGNTNTYCYHKYDIFDLLSNKSENTGKSIIFPSIVLIGYVDQGVEDYLLYEDINFNKLNAKKIVNKVLNDNSIVLSRGTYPGFNYFEKDTAKVKWLNITDDGTAAISVGSPVLGTIMPPTDGSAIKYDTVKVYLVRSEDLDTFADFPDSVNEESWADNKTKWILEASVAKAGEEGEKQVKLTAVGESLNFQVDSNPVDDKDSNWLSGYYKIRVSFKTSTLSSYSDCIFTVASGAPKLSEYSLSSENPYASYYRGYMTGATKTAGKNFLAGQSKTSDASNNLPLSYSYVKTGDSVEVSGLIAISDMENDEYKLEIPIDTETHEFDGEYTYTFKSEVVSLSTVISRIVVVDTIIPVIKFNNLDNNKIVPTRSYLVEGNISDTNGIEKVEYQLFADGTQIAFDGSTVSKTGWILVPSAKSSFSLQLSNLQKNKQYSLKLRATDAAGNITGDEEYTRNFKLNSDDPVIKINSISPQVSNAQGVSVNGTIKVKATVSDTNSIVSAYYTYDSTLKVEDNWATSGKATSFTAEEVSNGIEITVDTTKYTDKAKLPLRIKVVDEAENYAVSVIDPLVNQELDRPSITPSNFDKLASLESAGWKDVNSFNVFGSSNPNMIFTVADDDSVKAYFAKVDEGQYSKVADVDSAQKIVTYEVKGLPLGRHKITLRVEDEKYVNENTTPNNYVEEVFYIAIDDGAPTLILDNTNNQFVGSTFTVSGKVSDGNSIHEVNLKSSTGSEVYKTIGSESLANGTFDCDFKLEDMNNRDPIWIYAIDTIGNTSVVEFKYLIDSTPPRLEIINYVGSVDGSAPQARVEGKAWDVASELTNGDNGISKIDQVRAKIGSPITGLDDVDAVVAAGKIEGDTMKWSAIMDFTGYEAGTYPVYIIAYDIAGNMSKIEKIDVSIDAEFPTISCTSHSSTGNGTYDAGAYTGSFTLSGKATDDSEIKSISASIRDTNRTLNVSRSDDGIWTLIVPNYIGEGHINIIVAATDTCNKTSSITIKASLDTKDPILEFTNLELDNSTKQTNSNPVVNISYSDETSGVKTIEYEFWYKSNSDSDFAKFDHPNASGTKEIGNSSSGSFKLFMAGSSAGFINQESNTDGEWKVKYKITDAAEHSKEGFSPIFIVDRHSPVLEVQSPVANTLKKLNDPLTVKGTVKDNYGGSIDSVVVQVNHKSYTEQNRKDFSKVFTKEDLEYNPENKFYIWSVDWSEVNSPFKYSDDYEVVVTAYDTADNQYEIKNKVSCDNTAPKITFIKPYSYSVDPVGNISKGETVNSPIGLTTVTANIEDFRMESIFYQIGGTVKTTKDGNKITNISIENGGIQSSEVGNDVIPEFLSGIWKKLGDANNGFTADIDTLKYFNEGKTKERLDGDTENDSAIIQTLEIHLVAIDDAGNINYCGMPIFVDTDTDKPELLVLSPKIVGTTANVGGTTTISGTVSDDNNVHSVWMNVVLEGGNYVNNILTQKGESKTFGIDYSQGDYGITIPQSITIDEENKTFTSPSNDNAYFADKTKWYKVNLTEQAKSTTWNLMLNKDSEFDITTEEFRKYFESDASKLEETTLTVRLVALDVKDNDAELSKSKLSDISTFTLKIDSGSPSIVINNIQNIPVEGSYIGGKINYNLTFTDDGLITLWKVTAKGSKGEYVIASGTPNEKSFTTNVEVDTESVKDKCGNVITLKIYAEDNSNDGSGAIKVNKTSEETFKYTIDNSAPVGSVVETIDGKSYMITTESIEGDSTGALRETDDRGNHLRIKTASALLSGKVNDEINGSGVDYVMLYFTKNKNGVDYIYNAGTSSRDEIVSNNTISAYIENEGETKLIPFPVATLSDVKRNNNAHSTTNYIIIDKAEGLLDKGSNGDGDGYDENLRANGEWKLTFDSSNLNDGVYYIYYVVVDVAGNARYYKDSMLVQNSAPFISSVVLSTDIDGDGTCEVTVDGHGDEDKLYDSSSFDNLTGIANTDFVVRNTVLKIRVNVTGGKDPLKYYMRYKDSSGTEKNVTGTPEGDGKTGIFEITNFPDDGSTNYVIWVEDTVENDISLSSEVQTIKLTLDNKDDVAPVAQLYELNTDTDDSNARGSLFKTDGIMQGHIEPRSKSTFNLETPDISGKVILRGEVLDDQRISSISLNLNNSTVEIARWNGTSLVAVNEVVENKATLVKNELGLSGHYVEWAYVWNTNDFVGSDVIVSVTAKDATSNSSGVVDYAGATNTPRTEKNMFSLSGWGYNNMTMDVVPYITGLVTTLSKIEKRNPTVYGRSALGKYPVYYYRKTVSEGIESERITVQGFNILSDSTVTFEGGATTLLDGNNVFTLHENAKSGKISVSINGISSINNTNDNNAIGTKGEYYNQKPNGQNNDLLTDDVDILIWEINSKAAVSESGELSEVMMHVNPSNGMLGFAFAHSQDLASYPNGNNNSYETWITDWTGVNQISFAYDKNGNMFGTNGGTDTYTPNKKVGRLGLISSHWGVITNTSASNDWYSGYTKYRRLRLEYLGLQRNNAYASNVYRFAKGDAIQLATTYSEISGTNLYMLYYDNTLGELKFKAGNFDSHEGAIYNSASGDKWTKSDLFFGDFSDDAHYEKAGDSNNNYEPTYKTISIVANQNGANGDSNVRPGIYYSVDAVSSDDGRSDVVVAVWYDDVNKTLWYSYLVNPLDNAGNRDRNGAISTEWAKPIAILDGHAGGYNAIKVDDDGHIHIAAYSRNDAGSLYYAYLDRYDSRYNKNENLVAIDSYGSTGQYLTMEVAKDEFGNNIPYIGYYMSSMSYPKYAYLVDTESAKAGATYYPKPGVDENNMFTGAWESILLPTISTIVVDDINIGVFKKADGTLEVIPKQTESVGIKTGIAGGNDTANPIFAYGISQTGSGYIETAQLK